MRVSEIFCSIQGEGQFAGTPSVFVRTTGCNLRCWYCDTPYTSWTPEGKQTSWQAVVDEVLRWDHAHVVLTGGEPLLQPDIVPLSAELQRRGAFVTVETAGTIYRPVTADLMSLSPKLSNSTPGDNRRWRRRHERGQHRPEILRRLMAEYPYQLKFVIDQPADVDEVVEYLKQFPEAPPEKVWLMPQGMRTAQLAEKEVWLAPLAEQFGFRYCARRHIERFGNVRGT